MWANGSQPGYRREKGSSREGSAESRALPAPLQHEGKPSDVKVWASLMHRTLGRWAKAGHQELPGTVEGSGHSPDAAGDH